MRTFSARVTQKSTGTLLTLTHGSTRFSLLLLLFPPKRIIGFLSSRLYTITQDSAILSSFRRTDDVELEYQLLLARIDFSWESPVKNAQRLVNFSPAKKKGSAIIELAQV